MLLCEMHAGLISPVNLYAKMSLKFAGLHSPDSKCCATCCSRFVNQVWNYVFPKIPIRTGVGDYICETILALIYVASNQLHCTHRYPPNSSMLPAQPASWQPSSWIPSCPASFFCGCLDLHVRVFCVPSPKFSRVHCSSYWR